MSWMPSVGKALGGLFGGMSGPSTSQQQSAYAPFSSQYAQYQPQLANLVSNPSSVTSTPGYNFNLQQGETAVNQGEAGMGLLGSGKQGVDLTKFGQNYATNTYQTQLQNLMSLSGVGVNQNGSPTANAGAASSALGSQLGGLLGGGLSSIISDVGLA